MSEDAARDCVDEWRKYYDTVAVSSAIYHLFETKPPVGHFVGVEHKLVTSNPDEILTPDITAVFDGDTKGLLFELKYSLPSDVQSVKEELGELAKYGRAAHGWGVRGQVQSVDFVLVCHADDVKRAVDASQQLSSETRDPFYDPSSFSIWYWMRSTPREAQESEEMRLLHAYGATRNAALQDMVGQPGGIAIPEEVLTTLRFTNVFIRQKPPVQYTIVLLIQNVFSALPPPGRFGRRSYEVSLDVIYQKSNALFPPWWERDVRTVQVRRGWIKEALDTLVKLKLTKEISGQPESYSIPIPTVVTRKQLQEAICQRLVAYALRARGPRGRPRTTARIPRRRPKDIRPLPEFFRNH